MKDWKYLNHMMENDCPKDLIYGDGKSRWINARVTEMVNTQASKLASDKGGKTDQDEDDDDEILTATGRYTLILCEITFAFAHHRYKYNGIV